MTIEHVKQGDVLSARRWNEMVDRINDADLAGVSGPPAGTKVLIKNGYSRTIQAGEALPVIGMKAGVYTASQARQHFLDNGYVLNGGSSASNAFAIAEDNIRANEYGPAVVEGLTPGMVYVKPNESWSGYADFNFSAGRFENAEQGAWVVITKSALENSEVTGYEKQRWCFLIKRIDTERVIRTTDQNFISTISPELSAGSGILFSDGGDAGGDAASIGSGKKCEISWAGASAGRQDWSTLTAGVTEFVFGENTSAVSVSNGRAKITPMAMVNGNRCEKIVFQGNGVSVSYSATNKTATITIN